MVIVLNNNHNHFFVFFSVLHNLQVRFCDRNDIYTYCGKKFSLLSNIESEDFDLIDKKRHG